MNGNLTGNYRVRAVRPAFQDAHKWLPRSKDRARLRRHALKLRFWPEKHPEDAAGILLDLDWSWIKAMKGSHVGELRVHDQIGDCDNLRVIFFDPKDSAENILTQLDASMPIIWVLSVFQKKRDDFTKAQIRTFRARRTLVLERFYDNP